LRLENNYLNYLNNIQNDRRTQTAIAALLRLLWEPRACSEAEARYVPEPFPALALDMQDGYPDAGKTTPKKRFKRMSFDPMTMSRVMKYVREGAPRVASRGWSVSKIAVLRSILSPITIVSE
jgi:hypothetical protein